MTKFYDNDNILEITMRDPNTNEDFSADFFEDACNWTHSRLKTLNIWLIMQRIM